MTTIIIVGIWLYCVHWQCFANIWRVSHRVNICCLCDTIYTFCEDANAFRGQMNKRVVFRVFTSCAQKWWSFRSFKWTSKHAFWECGGDALVKLNSIRVKSKNAFIAGLFDVTMGEHVVYVCVKVRHLWDPDEFGCIFVFDYSWWSESWTRIGKMVFGLWNSIISTHNRQWVPFGSQNYDIFNTNSKNV